MREADWEGAQAAMVETLVRYGIRNERVLKAMAVVPRHRFIPGPPVHPAEAYGDHPYSIGHGQTISQPFIVAHMIEQLELAPGERVLEIGSGSGYVAAVLAEMGQWVFGVEIVPALARWAEEVLAREGYSGRVRIWCGDGRLGWPEEAPFDAMIGSCAAAREPRTLWAQLREGGRAIFPIGDGWSQRLVRFWKQEGRIVREEGLPVRFVPLVEGPSVGRDTDLGLTFSEDRG